MIKDRSKWVICTSNIEGEFVGFKTLTGVDILECSNREKALPFNYNHIDSNIEIEVEFTTIKIDKGTIICYLKD